MYFGTKPIHKEIVVPLTTRRDDLGHTIVECVKINWRTAITAICTAALSDQTIPHDEPTLLLGLSFPHTAMHNNSSGCHHVGCAVDFQQDQTCEPHLCIKVLVYPSSDLGPPALNISMGPNAGSNGFSKEPGRKIRLLLLISHPPFI